MNVRSTAWRLVALVALVAACTGAGASASSAPTASAVPSAVISLSVSLSPPVSGAITRENDGQTLTLAVGDRVLLHLGNEFDWSVSVDKPSVVDRVRNITVVQGAQGVYEALAPGTAVLSATGDPPCRKVTPPCGAPSILFQVTLVVR